MSNKKDKKKSKKLEIKLFTSKTDMIVSIILIVIMIAFFLSPRIFWITTAKWTDWDKENKNNVVTAMGKENTEERFRLYFQYYNVLHEMGHGLLIYNKGVDVHIVDEEQLVNDFAVAYWNYYGEEEKMKELYDIVTYAVENVGDNHKKGIDYIKNAKEHSGKNRFHNDFFNFNDYGWFQFSCVKHSIEQNKSLEEVLKEMGFKDFELTEKELLIHDNMSEEESTKIINEAVDKFNEWGLDFPEAYQSFSDDPNQNMSRPFKNFLGIFNLLK